VASIVQRRGAKEDAMERPVCDRTLAAHLLKTLFEARAHAQPSSLDELSAKLGVRRNDVRAALSQLHREGCVDVLRMQLTLRGLALGAAFASASLKPVRGARRSAVAAA
jgi:DNA-binding IclR family transcriptional regulator